MLKKNTWSFLCEVDKGKNHYCVTYYDAVAVTGKSWTQTDTGKKLT